MLHEVAFPIKELDVLVEKMKQFFVLYDNRGATKITAEESWLEKSNRSEKNVLSSHILVIKRSWVLRKQTFWTVIERKYEKVWILQNVARIFNVILKKQTRIRIFLSSWLFRLASLWLLDIFMEVLLVFLFKGFLFRCLLNSKIIVFPEIIKSSFFQ